MDENSTFPFTQSLNLLHRHYGALLALLGIGDICQLYLFQQHQRYLPQDQAPWTTLSVWFLISNVLFPWSVVQWFSLPGCGCYYGFKSITNSPKGSLVGSNRPLPLLDDQTWIQFQTLGAHSRQPTIWRDACIDASLDRIYCRRYLQRSQRFQWLRSSHGCGAFLEGINPCSSCHSELNPSNLPMFVIENFRLTVVCSYHLSLSAYATPLSWTTLKQPSIGFERIGYANKPPARGFTHWVDRDKDVNEVMILNQVRERL